MRGRPRPRLAGGESGPSRRALPFSAVENLFMGAMGRDESRGRGEEEEAEQGEMDWKVSRCSVLIAGGGQPSSTTIAGNHERFLCMQGHVISCSCRSVVGSTDAHVQSIATRRPRPQAVGARGTPHFPIRFSAKPSPSAPWARVLLSALWERGSPDLPTCGMQRGSSSGPVRSVFINPSSRPSRGAKPRGADDMRLPQERPHQAVS